MLSDEQIEIRDRLIEGTWVELRQIMSGLRPVEPSSYWPDFGMTPHEVKEMMRERDRDKINTRETEFRVDPPTREQIRRADECIAWRSFVENPAHRVKLMARLQCFATHRSWAAHCRKKGWVSMTADRHVEKALQQINAAVRKECYFVEPADDEVMLQLLDNRGTRMRNIGASAA